MGLKVADRIISEENGFPEAMTEIRHELYKTFTRMKTMEPSAIRQHRYNKFRAIGVWE